MVNKDCVKDLSLEENLVPRVIGKDNIHFICVISLSVYLGYCQMACFLRSEDSLWPIARRAESATVSTQLASPAELSSPNKIERNTFESLSCYQKMHPIYWTYML